MKVTRTYRRPWRGDKAGHLIVSITTQQHGYASISLCPAKLEELRNLFHGNCDITPANRHANEHEILGQALARAVSDFIAQGWLNDRVEGPKP